MTRSRFAPVSDPASCDPGTESNDSRNDLYNNFRSVKGTEVDRMSELVAVSSDVPSSYSNTNRLVDSSPIFGEHRTIHPHCGEYLPLPLSAPPSLLSNRASSQREPFVPTSPLAKGATSKAQVVISTPQTIPLHSQHPSSFNSMSHINAHVAPIPSSLPSSFGQLGCPDDEHVTVWHPATGKTVAGNAAPYRRNLQSWLDIHEGWEEKADELKSSKRRSAARRARSAADSFAALCAYPVATTLVKHASDTLEHNHVADAGLVDANSWSNDDYVRLQSALYELAQVVHAAGSRIEHVPTDSWSRIAASFKPPKQLVAVISIARELLLCGLRKHMEAAAAATSSQHTDLSLSPIIDSSLSHGATRIHAVDSGAGPNAFYGPSLPHEISSVSSPSHGATSLSRNVSVENCNADDVGGTVSDPRATSVRTGRPVSAPIPFDVGNRADLHSQKSSVASMGGAPATYNSVAQVDELASARISCESQGFNSAQLSNSLPNMDAVAHFLDRSFRTPREPRITVWEPTTGRTISGNAAPCRKNVQSWLADHPGWTVKNEDQLSSSRRSRKFPSHYRTPITTVPSVSTNNIAAGLPVSFMSPKGVAPCADVGAPAITDAVAGLLVLGQAQDFQIDRASSAMDASSSSPAQVRAATSSVSSQSSRVSNDDVGRNRDVQDADDSMVDSGADEMNDSGMED